MIIEHDHAKSQVAEELHRLQQRVQELETAAAGYQKTLPTLQLAEQTLIRLKKAIETTGVGITITDADGQIIYTNPADARMHGYAVDEVLGQPSNIFTTPEQRQRLERRLAFEELYHDWERERPNMRKDGSVFPAKLVSNPIYDTEKFYIGTVTVCEDISSRKQAEEELRQYHQHLEALVAERTADLSAAINQANQWNEQLQQEIIERTEVERELRVSLQEKEILLKEVHHRVKNNLQIISSLLNLQANSLPDDPARRMFTASQHRIRALGLIHEKLYQSDDITHIDFNDYIKTLVAELQAIYRANFRNLQLVIRVTDVTLPLDIAIPCGLILNELASNAMKYAFANRDGVLTIAMRRKPDQSYEFVVSDNGVGLPPDCDPYHPQSLGLQLVKGLVEEQLEGTLELNTRRGVTWKIRFR